MKSITGGNLLESKNHIFNRLYKHVSNKTMWISVHKSVKNEVAIS